MDSSLSAASRPEALSEAMEIDSLTVNRRPGVLNSESLQSEETRASKRLCLPAGPPAQGFSGLFTSKVSSLLGNDSAASLTDLHAAVK